MPIDTLSYQTSGQAVMMALLGGMGTFFGPFIGAGLYLLLENLVSLYTPHWQLVVGAAFIGACCSSARRLGNADARLRMLRR